MDLHPLQFFGATPILARPEKTICLSPAGNASPQAMCPVTYKNQARENIIFKFTRSSYWSRPIFCLKDQTE